MSTTTVTTDAPSLATPDRTLGFRRRAGAIALPLAFVFQLACNAIYAWLTRHGGGDTGSGAQTLEFYAAHPVGMRAATVLAMIGGLLTIPGVLAAMRLLRPSRPRLSLWAGALMIAGYVCYLGIAMTNFITLALATSGVDAGAALDLAGADPFGAVFFLVFVVGNLIGTMLLGLAVLLSAGLPRIAGVLILGWPVGHIVNILVVNESFAVAGGALEIAGLVLLAQRVLRLSDERWARLG